MKVSAFAKWLPFVVGGAAAALAASNPFPVPIPKAPVVAEAQNFAVIPNFRGQTPRVQQLLAAPDGRIFVVDQLGAISTVSADGSRVTRYLDFAAVAGIDLVNSGELGLESLAFHPDFLNVGQPGYGKFYTAHTSSNTAPPADYAPGGGSNADDNVVLEWRAADPAANTFTAATPGTPFRELLRVEAPFGNHTIGLVAFNPNAAAGTADYGKLYVGFGDGGSGGDPLQLAQNRTKPHGKILRLDPLGTNGPNGKYGIPSDNPFVGTSGTLAEIWALGFRNPQRFSWDRAGARRMWIADIGQSSVEEIDFGIAGANYGWSQREGSFAVTGPGNIGANSRSDAATTGFTYPVAEYDHDEGDSITAGFVYRGTALPALAGKFLFGDIARGRVFFIDADAPPAGGQSMIRELRLRFGTVERSLLDHIQIAHPDSSRVDLRFGTDAAGRIFLLNKQDGIVRVLAAPAGRPTVRVAGNPKRLVARKFLRLEGSANSAVGLRAVEVKVNAANFRPARGTTRWHLTVRLHGGRNRIVVRAVDRNENRSAPRVVVAFVR